ncbi:unnamed protein product [Cylindrotheca closterium]|uniref:Methyltransferase type 11 domain-containing protein n=1 Tax=Cylindrotheca closterium TaxID=2856 RepID=A0AAD2FVU1_9STRA|nr:unnamed protein product [Cylindrotheca closterium]
MGRQKPPLQLKASPTDTTSTRAPPRTGLAQTFLNYALNSPLWKQVLVPQARQNIVKTAESNGIPWNESKEWIKNNAEMKEIPPFTVPEYYKNAFHAYEEGNLSWDAAWEVEIASCSVGARNFPQYGANGEDAFRGAFDSALNEASATVPDDGKILDLGCGTGMSTRRLARNFPQASSIQGIDLSPYFVEIGKQLLELEPKSFQEGGTWVSNVQNDSRILYTFGDAANTGFDDASFDVVNLQFVLHELPEDAALTIIDEALRVLKPEGQLWICEMDFESPAYAAQRANALLFSLIRSTEPYLDIYAESISDLFRYIGTRFNDVKILPATGRHYSLVATKGDPDEEMTYTDLRFDGDGEYRVEDTHLKMWESKEESP